MPDAIEHLTEQALKLPEGERARLAQALLLSLDDVPEEGVEEAWGEEVGRRLAEVRSRTAKGRPAEDVFRDMEKRRG